MDRWWPRGEAVKRQPADGEVVARSAQPKGKPRGNRKK